MPTKAAFAVSSQSTDYLRGVVQSFQEETRKLFYNSNVHLTQRLCKYGLRSSLDCAKLLSERSQSDLDGILCFLTEKKHSNPLLHDGDSTCLRKAKEIVWRIDDGLPALPLWDKQCVQSLFESHHTADEIAIALVQQMCSVLEVIPFSQFVAFFFGYPSDVIANLLSFIVDLRREFRTHLSTSAAVRSLIEEINKNPELQRSLAWWPVSTSLSCPDDDLDPSDALISIRVAIEDVLLQLRSPDWCLECLARLDGLYQDVAKGTDRWQSFFDFDKPRYFQTALLCTKSIKGPVSPPIMDDNISEGENWPALEAAQFEVALDWPTLLVKRVKEALEFDGSAFDEEKLLIKLYLPFLQNSTQNTLTQTITGCQWRHPRGLNGGDTAHKIGQHLMEHFGRVDFTDIVKESVWSSKLVCIEQLNACAARICHEYQSSEGLREELAQVKEELASQYPFVYDLISTTLGRCDDGVGLGPIIAFIQDLIAGDHHILTVFRRLELLRVRYEIAQTLEPVEPWSGQLSYDFDILDNLISMSSWEIAKIWTDKHKQLFIALRDDEFPTSNWLEEINATWNRLSRHVEECALASGSLVDKLAQIEIVFFRLRNYFAATAVHLGLRNARKYPQLTLIFNDVVDSTDNYKYYRQCWHDAPGLPFVYPHTHGLDPERKRADFFRFKEYPKWRSDGNVDDLTRYLIRQTSSSPPAHRTSWPVFITALVSQLQQIVPCFGFNNRLAAASNRCDFDLEEGLQVNRQESAVMSVSEDKIRRLTSAVRLESVIPSKSYKGWEDEVNCSRSKKRTCLFDFRSVRALCHSRIFHWHWAKAFSTPRRNFTYLWFLLSSLCHCEPFCSELDEKTYVLDPIYSENCPTPSWTDSYPALDQVPAKDPLVDYDLSNIDDKVCSIPHSANYHLSSGPNTCLSNSSNAKDNPPLSPSDPCLLQSRQRYTCLQMDNSHQSSISSMETWAKKILFDADSPYILLVLMQGPPNVRSKLTEILSDRGSAVRDQIWKSVLSNDKAEHLPSNLDHAIDVMRQVDPELPQLPVIVKWKPRLNMTAKDTAATVDETLSFPFRLIPFTEIRDAVVYGHKSDLVAHVLDGILSTYNEMCQLFTEHPEQRAVYEEAKKMMLFPVSIAVVSNSLLNLPRAPPPSDALHFIFQPIQEVFRRLCLGHAAKLERLCALEVAYTKMVRDRRGWWALFELPHGIRHAGPIDVGWEILRMRQEFSRSKDIIANLEHWGHAEAVSAMCQIKRDAKIRERERTKRLGAEGKLVCATSYPVTSSMKGFLPSTSGLHNNAVRNEESVIDAQIIQPPYRGIIAETKFASENTTLGMTDNEVYKSYTFVLLSTLIGCPSIVNSHLDNTLGDHQDIPGFHQLSDKTWEIVVYKGYVTELTTKLEALLPRCCVYVHYDPTKPSEPEIKRMGYEAAKAQKKLAFFDRAQSMKSSWPIAAKYYSLRAEQERGVDPFFEHGVEVLELRSDGLDVHR